MTEPFNNFITYGKQVYSGLKQVKNSRLSQLRKVFSLMGKREKIALLVLAILAAGNLFLSLRNFYINHSVIAPGFGGNYTEGVLGQPLYINPLLAHQEPDLSLTRLVFSGLYKYDNDGQLAPDLAEGMPVISDDQKQYSINLKKNVKWHNDKPFTADDVVFTIQTLKDQAYKSPLRSLWQSTTVEKTGDFSVKFTTKTVSGPFIQNLTLPILPQSVWNRVEAQNFLLSENNLKAVGTGPFAIKEIKKLSGGKIDQITLASFVDYFGGKPNLATVVIKFYDNEDDILNALHSKEITGYGFAALGSSIHLEKDQDNLQIYTIPLPQYQVVFFNLNNKVLADLNVRKALSLAADRQKIIDEVFKGQALLPVSPLLLSGGTTPGQQTLPADTAAAAKLLDEAGWKIDPKTNLRAKKAQVLEFGFSTNDYLLNSKAAENLADQWRALNIKVNLAIVPSKQLTDGVIRPRNFDVLLFPQKFNADPDPFVFWHSSQIKDPGFNLTGFTDPAADKLITEARTTTDQAVREQKYREFDALISAAAPVILLNETVFTYALDKNLKNVQLRELFEPSQRFYDIAGWYLEEKRVWK